MYLMEFINQKIYKLCLNIPEPEEGPERCEPNQ